MSNKNHALNKKLNLQGNSPSRENKYSNLKIVKIEEEKDLFVKIINGNRLANKWTPEEGDYQADIPNVEEYDPRKDKRKKNIIFLSVAFFIVIAVTILLSYALSVS